MLDIRRLRSEPDAVRRALARRDPELPAAVDRVMEVDERRREALGVVNDLKAERNEASKRVGELKRAGDDADGIIARTKELGERISELDEVVRDADDEIRRVLLDVPNMPLDEVPSGGEDDNVVLCTWGEAAVFDFEALAHWDLGERLGVLDLARGAKVSGSGFPVLRGLGARLQRGLINFFLDVHTGEHGYTEPNR
jgi:seryl-tRNA synthetase